ncbi:hypothetical protein PROFUN_12850 [Planoprotostelium fungivorum]|uniref:Uncharacterized protein n=1 Tax=Planoprotostelium fungivorum TaxID=1890364 RepID=A0A2P6N697_9EUKA|nr:hypothetical protein PROFUN_12850 [Planoprotostelium fungivorum]
MRSLLCLYLITIVAIFGQVGVVAQITSSVSSPNSTSPASPASPPASFCSDDCDGHGICWNTGVCNCWRGWSGTKNKLTGESHCSLSYIDQGFEEPIKAMRIIFSICYGFQLLLVSYRLFLEKFGHRTGGHGLAPVSITRLIMVVLWLDIILQFFWWALDFRNNYGVMNIKYSMVVEYLQLPNLILLFSILLAYWIDFYQAVIMKVKKEEMLRKINSNYESKVTYEDILLQISKMRRVKIVVVVINVICYAFFITFEGMLMNSPYPKTAINTYVGMVTWFAFVSLVLGVGYTLAGHKLIGLMPPQLSDRIRRLTRKMILVAIALTVFNLFGMAANVNSPPGTTLYLAKSGVTTALGLLVRMLAIDIYLPFANIKRWLFGMSFGTSSTDKTGPSSNRDEKNTRSMEVDIELTAHSTS